MRKNGNNFDDTNLIQIASIPCVFGVTYSRYTGTVSVFVLHHDDCQAIWLCWMGGGGVGVGWRGDWGG